MAAGSSTRGRVSRPEVLELARFIVPARCNQRCKRKTVLDLVVRIEFREADVLVLAEKVLGVLLMFEPEYVRSLSKANIRGAVIKDS
jgi:hypothetical protein